MSNKQKLEALLYVMSKSKLHILECEALAKDLEAHDRMTFDLVGPKGRFRCQWVDAHYGIFIRTNDGPGRGGFNTSQFKYAADIHCENLDEYGSN